MTAPAPRRPTAPTGQAPAPATSPLLPPAPPVPPVPEVPPVPVSTVGAPGTAGTGDTAGTGGSGVSTVLGAGVDLVHVPGLAHQLTIPGTVLAERAFTPRELREARRRADESGSLQAEHLAGRWAAKEAVIKAWSAAVNARAGGAVAPVMAPEAVNWREIELVTDRWGRPGIRLAGAVADAVRASLGPGADEGARWPVSVSHDGDYAVAVVLVTAPRAPLGPHDRSGTCSPSHEVGSPGVSSGQPLPGPDRSPRD